MPWEIVGLKTDYFFREMGYKKRAETVLQDLSF